MLRKILFSGGVRRRSFRLCLKLISLSGDGPELSLQLGNLCIELCLRRAELLEAGPVLLVVFLTDVPLITNGCFGCSKLKK